MEEENKAQVNAINICEIVMRIKDKHDQLMQKAKELAAQIDAEYAFQLIIFNNLCDLQEGYKERTHGLIPSLIELSAYYLYPFFGQKIDVRNRETIGKLIAILCELNENRVAMRSFGVENESEFNNNYDIRSHVQTASEIVRGNAYPCQTRQVIEGIQCLCSNTLKTIVGIAPKEVLAIIDAYFVAFNRNHEAQCKKYDAIDKHDAEEVERFLNEAPLSLAVSYSQIQAIVPSLNRTEWNSLIQSIGCTPESVKQTKEPRDIKYHPVYCIDGHEKILIFDIGTTYEAVFYSFDIAAKTCNDKKFSDRTYPNGLKSFSENETCKYLGRIFGASNIFHELTYPDPDNKNGEAELDAAVLFADALLVVEVKAKQYRKESRNGSLCRLSADIRNNIKDSFEQATRAIKYVNQHEYVEFVEKQSKRTLSVRKDHLRVIVPISVTLHDFGDLTTQLSAFKGLGLFSNSEYPWAVSLPCLDVVTSFINSPDVFLHYIKRRTEIQNSGVKVQGDELDLLGYYLDMRLQPDLLWDRKDDDGRALTGIFLSGGSERFDDWYRIKNGFSDDALPCISLKLPAEIEAVLCQIKSSSDVALRSAASALLDLHDVDLEHISYDIRNSNNTVGSQFKLVSTRRQYGDMAISLLFSNGHSVDRFEEKVRTRAKLEKYRFRTSKSLAIGIDASKHNNAYDFIEWLNFPWNEDKEIDGLIANEPKSAMLVGKMPERNDPCPCGSGKKFKKCCMNKYQFIMRK